MVFINRFLVVNIRYSVWSGVVSQLTVQTLCKQNDSL